MKERHEFDDGRKRPRNAGRTKDANKTGSLASGLKYAGSNGRTRSMSDIEPVAIRMQSSSSWAGRIL